MIDWTDGPDDDGPAPEGMSQLGAFLFELGTGINRAIGASLRSVAAPELDPFALDRYRDAFREQDGAEGMAA